jgi:circadian clock protein KaiC
MSNLIGAGSRAEAGSMLIRLVDYLKSEGITGLFTILNHSGVDESESNLGISSIIDTWIQLKDVERDGARVGLVYVAKSRGMEHSRQMRVFRMTSRGIEVPDAPGGKGRA